MTSGSFLNALKGIGGEYEITRVVGFLGGTSYILGAHAFVAWNMAEGRDFDLTAYCVAFPGGMGVMIAAIAGAASVKDRNVAVAKATEAKTKADAEPRTIADAEDAAAGQVVEAATGAKDKIVEDRR